MRYRGLRAGILATALMMLGWGGAPLRALADTLVADLSDNTIEITSDFHGRDLVLFGAIDRSTTPLTQEQIDQGIRDVVIVIRGPGVTAPLVVRKKKRIGGIWANAESVVFTNVPDYYFVAASRDFEDIAPADVFRRNEIRTHNLTMKPVNADLTDEELATYRDAIIRNKTRDNLFYEKPGGVVFLDKTLFRANIKIPANVSVGVYRTEVYLFVNGRIVSVQRKPLYINKIGFDRSIYEFAIDWPFFYGLLAVIFALLAGWLASLVFRQE